VILPGSALALLVGHASCWVYVGFGKSALSGLPELSFMIGLQAALLSEKDAQRQEEVQAVIILDEIEVLVA